MSIVLLGQFVTTIFLIILIYCEDMISDEHIKKFQELYFTHFGIHLDRNEAYEKASKLVRLIQLIYKPMTEERYLLLKANLEKSRDLHKK